MKSLIECIPNVSEGRREEVVARLAESPLKAAPGVLLLDRTSGCRPQTGRSSPIWGTGLRSSRGWRPSSEPRSRRSTSGRIEARTRGSAPSMSSRSSGAQRHDGGLRGPREGARPAPRRASRPAGLPLRGRGHGARPQNLANIRKGEFEGLAAKMEIPPGSRISGRPHPTRRRGNRHRGPRAAHRVQHHLARRISPWRTGSPGPSGTSRGATVSSRRWGEARGARPGAGFDQHDEHEKTPLHRVFETVKSEAERHGVAVVGSEIVGLVPAEALFGAASHYLRLEADPGPQGPREQAPRPRFRVEGE